MEGVEGLMGKLRLSEEERGGVKIGGGGSRRSRVAEPQAVGKVLAEKLVSPETLERTLGRVWCPIKGVLCKDMGENHFLFTFLQASGKRRALEDGPWMISKDLVVMVDFDESKTLDEMEFIYIPIWVRVSNLPFGMMDKETGATLGEKIGVFKDVDVGEDGTAMGRVLWIKVGNPEREKCSFAYEYLLDFCYTCGHIGHVDKQCSIQCEKGEPQQFSRSLRFILEKKRGEGSEERRFFGAKQRGPWISGSSGSRGSYETRGDRWGSSGSGSAALNWRKGRDEKSTEKGEEVTSPEKLLNAHASVAADGSELLAKKSLLPQLGAPGSVAVVEGGVAGKGSEDDLKKDGKRGKYKRLDKTRPVKIDDAKGDKGDKI
ncbi:unnamed protein product [Miscanthus lutarioriparius]|uniref:CCHC-type domain-containing protein n=1 Tax=Miscanthus lutarioriparius TaxID=422564 RepID=A0A811Q676_9POAL|nr:unnamed protein product [Miscanthus lutarioriparius]